MNKIYVVAPSALCAGLGVACAWVLLRKEPALGAVAFLLCILASYASFKLDNASGDPFIK